MVRPSLERASYVFGGYNGMGFSTARPSVAGGRSFVLAARDPRKFAANDSEHASLGRTQADVAVEAVRASVSTLRSELQRLNCPVNVAEYLIPRAVPEHTGMNTTANWVSIGCFWSLRGSACTTWKKTAAARWQPTESFAGLSARRS
jgi:NAD(P)-dependent dehydrogenase (short-subunit alcohol dehydrogenase family)